MSENVRPVCGSSLRVAVTRDLFASSVILMTTCLNCKNHKRNPFTVSVALDLGETLEGPLSTIEGLITLAITKFREAKEQTAGKKFVEIDDNIGGGVWVDKEEDDDTL